MTKITKNFDHEHKTELQKAKQQIIWFIIAEASEAHRKT